MGKQINFYLKAEDLQKIEEYLLKRQCIFIEDIIFSEPKAILATNLVNGASPSKYVGFASKKLNYFSWDNENKFRLQQISSPVMEFSIYQKRNDFYRARFFYESTFLDQGERKNKDSEFEKFVDRFFRWFRRNYKAVPESPFFLQNPDVPVKELF